MRRLRPRRRSVFSRHAHLLAPRLHELREQISSLPAARQELCPEVGGQQALVRSAAGDLSKAAAAVARASQADFFFANSEQSETGDGKPDTGKDHQFA
jgi:hypothetical protein